MRIFCSICKDIFIPYSEIQATNCGHLYHGSCISRWLQQHKSCPQCRANLQSQLIRVYFDVDKDNEVDASTLEHQIDTLTNDLRRSEALNKTLKTENEMYEDVLNGMAECNADMKRKNDLLKSSVRSLKEQVLNLSKKCEAAAKLKDDFDSLKVKMITYERLDFILNTTSQEVDKFLKQTPVTEFGIRQLSIYASALKDKTERDKEKINRLSAENKELQKALLEGSVKSLSVTDVEFQNLKASCTLLQTELDTAKVLLKEYSDKLETKDKENLPLLRSQSQVLPKQPLFNITFELVEGVEEKSKRKLDLPDVTSSLKHWEDIVTAGPSRQLGLGMNKSKLPNITSSNVLNITKSKRTDLKYTFDGMGGSKKICLAHPTPQDEFEKIKKPEKKKTLDVTKLKKMGTIRKYGNICQ